MDYGLDVIDAWPRAKDRSGVLHAFAVSEWLRATRYGDEQNAPTLNRVMRRLGLEPLLDLGDPLDTGFLPA